MRRRRLAAAPRRPRRFPEIIPCPECGAPAEVLDRFALPSTDSPVEHIKARCLTGPWFVFPVVGADVPERRPPTLRSPRALATAARRPPSDRGE